MLTTDMLLRSAETCSSICTSASGVRSTSPWRRRAPGSSWCPGASEPMQQDVQRGLPGGVGLVLAHLAVAEVQLVLLDVAVEVLVVQVSGARRRRVSAATARTRRPAQHRGACRAACAARPPLPCAGRAASPRPPSPACGTAAAYVDVRRRAPPAARRRLPAYRPCVPAQLAGLPDAVAASRPPQRLLLGPPRVRRSFRPRARPGQPGHLAHIALSAVDLLHARPAPSPGAVERHARRP